MLLACNDAGLGLLRRDELQDVLNRNFEDFLNPEHIDCWREFTERVWTDGAGSLECELAAGAEGLRAIHLQAIALRNHPDAVESLLIAARDASSVRRLEDALESEARVHREIAALESLVVAVRAELQQATAERDQLIADRDQAHAESNRSIAERDEVIVARNQTLAELADAHAERERLAASLEAATASRDRLTREHRDELSRIQQLAEHHQLAALESERHGRERIAELERNLTSATLEHQRVTQLLDRHRSLINDAQVSAEYQNQQIADLELQTSVLREKARRLGETVDTLDRERQQLGDQLARRESEWHDAVDRLGEADAERVSALEDVKQAASEVSKLRGELDDLRSSSSAGEARALASIADLQARLEKAAKDEHDNRALEHLRAEHTEVLAERARVGEVVDQLTAELRRQTAEHETARAQMERTLRDARAEATRQHDRDRQALADAHARLAQFQEEHERAEANRDRERSDTEANLQRARRLGEIVDALEREREQLADQLARRQAECHDAIDRLGEADAARVSALEDLKEARTELSELRSELDDLRSTSSVTEARALASIADLEARLERAALHEHDSRALEHLRAEHTVVLEERARIGELVGELTTELRRQTAEHDAARTQMERTLVDARAEATRQHDRDRQALADAHARLAQFQKDHERAEASRDRERSDAEANLQAEVAVRAAEQKRLQAMLARSDAEHQRLLALHAAERVEIERTLGEAVLQRNELAKQLADERVELKHWRDAALELEPAAAVGRLANKLARELHELIAALDERTRLLLEISPVDATYRAIVETLRGEAARTALLARRLAHVDLRAAGEETAQ